MSHAEKSMKLEVLIGYNNDTGTEQMQNLIREVFGEEIDVTIVRNANAEEITQKRFDVAVIQETLPEGQNVTTSASSSGKHGVELAGRLKQKGITVALLGIGGEISDEGPRTAKQMNIPFIDMMTAEWPEEIIDLIREQLGASKSPA